MTLLLFIIIGMDLLQPLIFSLQAKEEDLASLLPQLMQNPFFNPSQKHHELFGVEPSVILSSGYIRLGVKVDTVIYDLLSSFCTKGPGSKQADSLINTGLKTAYSLPTEQAFQFKCQNGPPLFANGYIIADNVDSRPESTDSSGSEDDVIREVRGPLTKCRSSTCSSITSSGFGTDHRDSTTAEDFLEPQMPANAVINNLKRSSSGGGRRTSVFTSPWANIPSEQRKVSVLSDVSVTSILGSSGDCRWQVEVDSRSNDMIIGCHNENSYSILSWNPKFRVEFEIGSQEDGMSTSTYCVGSNKPSVSFHISNPGNEPMAFSIRAYRQSKMFRSHIIYPRDGLKYLDVQEDCWQDFDVVGSEGTKRDEHIIIDLLICKLHGEPSWNVQRRYVILKYDNKPRYDNNNNNNNLFPSIIIIIIIIIIILMIIINYCATIILANPLNPVSSVYLTNYMMEVILYNQDFIK